MTNHFCPKCGKQLTGDVRFCQHCGAEQIPSPYAPPSVFPNASVPFAPKQRKMLWPVFAGIGAGVVVLAAVVLFLTGVIRFGSAPPQQTAMLPTASAIETETPYPTSMPTAPEQTTVPTPAPTPSSVSLVNAWISEDTSGVSVYTFSPNGTYTQQITDYGTDADFTEEGTYSVLGSVIELSPYEYESYSLEYEISGNSLILTYDDGMSETYDLYTP